MTEREVGVIHFTGHRSYTDWGMRKYYFPLVKPKDNPITVKGNSRQEVVQGKHHSWPVAKKRKGFNK